MKLGNAITVGQRIKKLRLERNWSQVKLSQKLKVHQKQISGYERGVHIPSTDLLMRIAQLFNVSLDFLAFDDREDALQVNISDRDLIAKLEDIDKLSEKDKITIKAVIDSFIIKSRFQQLANITETSTGS